MRLETILTSDNVLESINRHLEELTSIIPEIKNMIGFDHRHPDHHLDVWNHTLLALSMSENIFEIRLILLLHDIGKPFSYQEGEIRHFKGHPIKSSMIARSTLQRLGYEENFINEVCTLIEYHDTKLTEEDIINNPELSIKRYYIQNCDALAHNPESLEKRKEYLNKIEPLIKKYIKY